MGKTKCVLKVRLIRWLDFTAEVMVLLINLPTTPPQKKKKKKNNPDSPESCMFPNYTTCPSCVCIIYTNYQITWKAYVNASSQASPQSPESEWDAP